MVSSNKASLDLRETHPLSRNISHTSCGDTRQRPNPEVVKYLKGYRCWSVKYTSAKVETGYSIYPVSGRDTAKSRIGFRDNRHLSYLAEFIFVNVGDSQQNEKVSRSTNVCCECRSDHSSQRLGKPATRRRVAVCRNLPSKCSQMSTRRNL